MSPAARERCRKMSSTKSTFTTSVMQHYLRTAKVQSIMHFHHMTGPLSVSNHHQDWPSLVSPCSRLFSFHQNSQSTIQVNIQDIPLRSDAAAGPGLRVCKSTYRCPVAKPAHQETSEQHLLSAATFVMLWEPKKRIRAKSQYEAAYCLKRKIENRTRAGQKRVCSRAWY
jgi:hypothetical protein